MRLYGRAGHQRNTHALVSQPVRQRFGSRRGFSLIGARGAKSAPDAKVLLLLLYFFGEGTPIYDANAKGSFFGLNLTHKRGDMYRALIEGIAYETRHVTDTFSEISHPPHWLLAVGGGTKNAVWLQATSDICGLRQEMRKNTAGASYGDAFWRHWPLAPGEAHQY